MALPRGLLVCSRSLVSALAATIPLVLALSIGIPCAPCVMAAANAPAAVAEGLPEKPADLSPEASGIWDLLVSPHAAYSGSEELFRGRRKLTRAEHEAIREIFGKSRYFREAIEGGV